MDGLYRFELHGCELPKIQLGSCLKSRVVDSKNSSELDSTKFSIERTCNLSQNGPMAMKIKFWGVRGSIPYSLEPHKWILDFEDIFKKFFKMGYTQADQISKFINEIPLPQLVGFGNATTCVELKTEHASLLIDGGTGLKGYSDDLVQTRLMTHKEHHIFLTHFHWDHLLGIPFFSPIFIPGHTIHFYSAQKDMDVWIKGKFRKPYFPVPFEGLRANIHFHVLEPRKKFEIGDIALTPYRLDHPDECWGLKVESGGKVYSHCSDTEGRRLDPQDLGEDLPLYQNVDLMYFDSQYSSSEFILEKNNWGHSAVEIGLELAFREGIRHVLFGHHDPHLSKQNFYHIKEQTKHHYNQLMNRARANRNELPKVKWRFAYEGLEVDMNSISEMEVGL